MKLVSVWWDGQWARAPRSPRVLGLAPALSSLLPRRLPAAICGACVVGTLAGSGSSRGNVLLVPTSWPWHPRSLLAPAPGPDQSLLPLLCRPPKSCSGTPHVPQHGPLTPAGEGPGGRRAGSIQANKGGLPARSGSVLISMRVAREGVAFSANQTVLTAVAPTFPRCLPRLLATAPAPQRFFQPPPKGFHPDPRPPRLARC